MANSTHQQTATKAGHDGEHHDRVEQRGERRGEPRVRSGSVTAYRNRRPSSGLDFFSSGSAPSALSEQPERAQLLVDQRGDVVGA